MPSGFLGQLVVNFVLLLICFIAYSSQIFIIWPWYGRVLSVELVTLLLPFNIFVGLLLWNYFLSVYTDPGRVPDNWKPDTNADGYEVKRLTGNPRYCRMCERPKPPRTHHCRQCGRCVLRMDHHCPWINNCVGHHNHGHFIRFLFFVDVSCSYHLAMVWRRLYISLGNRYWARRSLTPFFYVLTQLQDEPDGTEMIFMILNMVACIPVLLCVGIFSLYHFNAIRNNTTTIERWEKDKVATMVRRGRIQEIKFPYNIGTRRNIESVLGKNHWLWCWPTKTPGSGLKYEITSNDENSDGESWPPHHDTIEGESSHKEFSLPDSPWTFENGTVNPTLQPSNSARRRAKNNGASTLPPYHPDYQPDASDSDDYDEDDTSRVRIRRGSEGYEVRPGNREDMLNRYLSEIGEKRYHYYVPEPASGSESEGEQAPLVKSG
ncbi:Palmitoyltransferase PFA4 [Mycena indigotica]|uniref:Palmitoyltransferase PFA4 n=1 Tax=Mycena indigotica TaxID=2126181 RepID=A0A8H6SWD7_9AGAR|nr:Palmitoyltransferase PFA4 [Mycena indigotica]KAF7307153.1 Palmitoyltransferase PFA4 [Mycena indigotica]